MSTPNLSDLDAKMKGRRITEEEEDELVRKSSSPNLASLFKRGKDAGLIKPGKEYGNSA